MIECPKELVCFTEEEWVEFIMEYELEIIDEANMTGTGASFSAGAGEGYATPRAFGRKGKENKATKYAKKMGYKVVDKKD